MTVELGGFYLPFGHSKVTQSQPMFSRAKVAY
jgi:hypothetical protein